MDSEIELNNTEYDSYIIQGKDIFIFTQKVGELSAQCFLGLIAFTSLETGLALRWQASSLNIPLSIITKEQLFLSSLIVPFDCRLRNEAIVAIVMKQEWKNFLLLHEDVYDDDCVQDLLRRLSLLNISSEYICIAKEDSSRVLLTMIKNQDIFENVCLVTHSEQTVDLIVEVRRLAISLDMFNTRYQWILNLDPGFLQNNTIFRSLHQGFVLTLNVGLQHEKYRALITTISKAYREEMEDSRAENLTQSCFARAVTPFEVYNQLISNIKITIHSSSKEMLKFEEVAQFTLGNGLITRNGELYENSFRDFGNRVLKVASVTNAPYVMKGTNNNGSSYYYGFCYDILSDFAETFNFRYQSVDAIDGLFGNPTEDGLNATGMVGMVMRGEVDIGVAPFAVTATRDRVIDYVLPFQEDGVGILMKRVENKADKFFRVFLPLDYTSWLGIILATVMTSCILYYIAKLSPQSSPGDLPLSRNVWLIVGTVYGQDDGTRPSFESGRIILGFWWVFTILITASYTANLAAFFTISLAKPPVKNLEELASQTIYKPLIVQETNHHAMFKEATEGLYKSIWNMMSDMPKIKTVEEGYELVKTGQYALLWDHSQFQYFIHNDCGSLEIAQESFNKISLSFIIPENAPFKKVFDDHMLRMLEGGIIAKFRAKWWRKDKCISITKKATTLKMDSLSGIFVLYAAILGLVAITFTCEVIRVYRKWKQGTKVDNDMELSKNAVLSSNKHDNASMNITESDMLATKNK
ncbi:glutamate receptor ionotropic, kainate 2-like [Saccostrea echinata]|uniref:glutamate receptor ionotropic, kainate 2-like n=1 Tax=Saccostrea echinata TaxID=191078 RepID=UPI002A7F7224|nr:glutamate receptor ionotropic, kainate 2-like [Saccostrea echinata]